MVSWLFIRLQECRHESGAEVSTIVAVEMINRTGRMHFVGESMKRQTARGCQTSDSPSREEASMLLIMPPPFMYRLWLPLTCLSSTWL